MEEVINLLEIFQEKGDTIVPSEKIGKNCWVNVSQPTKEERNILLEELGIREDFITKSLDPAERPHIDQEEGQTLLVIDVPMRKRQKDIEYSTFPLGIILLEHVVVTLSYTSSPVLDRFKDNKIKHFSPARRIEFVFQLVQQIAGLYLRYLKDLNKKREEIERELRKSMENKELYSLLDLEESLVYFTTSLRANESVLTKIKTLDVLPSSPEEEELMEDTMLEMKQALTMANTYSNILSDMMDAFASVISNKLNIVMRVLTSIAIVMAIPTLVASIYGMNVDLPLQHHPFAFLILLLFSIGLSMIVASILVKKEWI